MSIEALIPCCATCKRPNGPTHCAYWDYITEGTHPCSFGILSVQSQIARNRVVWTPENLYELGLNVLKPKTVDESMSGVIKELGRDWAVKKYGGRYSAGPFPPCYGSYRMSDGSVHKLLYVRLPLPSNGGATAMPLIISDQIFQERLCPIYDNGGFNPDSLVFGDEKMWDDVWQRWWKMRGTTLTKWNEKHKDYRRALYNDGFPNNEKSVFMEATKYKMIKLVKKMLGLESRVSNL